jgi:hypothetical protein
MWAKTRTKAPERRVMGRLRIDQAQSPRGEIVRETHDCCALPILAALSRTTKGSMRIQDNIPIYGLKVLLSSL